MTQRRKYDRQGLLNALHGPGKIDHQRFADRAGDAPGQHPVGVLAEGRRPHCLCKTGGFTLENGLRPFRREISRGESGAACRDDEINGTCDLGQRFGDRLHPVRDDTALNDPDPRGLEQCDRRWTGSIFSLADRYAIERRESDGAQRVLR